MSQNIIKILLDAVILELVKSFTIFWQQHYSAALNSFVDVVKVINSTEL